MKQIVGLLLAMQLVTSNCLAQIGGSIKLFRFGTIGNEKPAVLTADGQRLNVSAFGGDYNEQFFAGNGIEVLEKWLAKNRDKCPPVPKNARIASCVARPSKIVAIGLNYAALPLLLLYHCSNCFRSPLICSALFTIIKCPPFMILKSGFLLGSILSCVP